MTALNLVKVVPWFVPATRFGGVVAQAETVCRELARRGHRLSVVTTDNGVGASVPRGRWVELEGYRVYYAPTRPWHRVVPYPAPAMRPALDEALPGADVCCLNVGLTLCNSLAAGRAASHGVPYVYNAEGALCPERLRIKGWRKHLFLRSVERPLLRGAAACQALTPKDVEDLARQGVDRARIAWVPNGVEPFVPGDARRFRARFGIAEATRIVLFLGRLHAIKGVDLLAEAFVRSAPEDAVLVLAGPDDDGIARRAEAALPGRVVRTGHLDGDDKRDALTAADLFALTSRTEGLPIAVLEALAAGLPCLLTTACNVPEVAEYGAGRVVAVDVEAIADGLQELLAAETDRAAHSVAARRLQAERFSVAAVVDRLVDLYAGLSAGA